VTIIKAKPVTVPLVQELVSLARLSWRRPGLDEYLAERAEPKPGPGLGHVFHTAGDGFWLLPGDLDEYEKDTGFWLTYCWLDDGEIGHDEQRELYRIYAIDPREVGYDG